MGCPSSVRREVLIKRGEFQTQAEVTSSKQWDIGGKCMTRLTPEEGGPPGYACYLERLSHPFA